MATSIRLLVALAWLTPLVGLAQPRISISAAWVRATPPGATNAAAYFEITNDGPADRLVGVSSVAAHELQLHMNAEEHGMQHMQRLAEIAVPEHGTVALSPGGLHVMLLGIAAPLRPGDHVTMTLHFTNAGDVDIDVPVLDGRTESPH
jgi:copper(I)-binding protein